jgi:hypothetical protein
MKRQTHRRLLILLVTGVIMALVWLFIASGCGTPTTTPPDRVRRLATAVWAGSPGNNPPLLANGSWKNLNTNDSVRTDQFGEAELELDGCNGSVWVFDNSTLSVWTCTKQAESDNEFWCTEEGTAGFNIDCAARFVVDTPSALVTIQGTAFTVTYLPENRLTLVTVFRGVVEVAPVLDMGTMELGPPVPVEEGFFLYTMPGGLSPEIGGVPPREARPLDELPIIVYELDIRGRMDGITRWGDGQQLLPPDWPFWPDQVTVAFDGGQLTDTRVQEAFVAAIDKEQVMGQAFPDQDIQFTTRIGDELLDAYTIPYDPDMAQALLEEAGYDAGQPVTILFPEEDDQVTTAAKWIAGNLSLIGIPVELTPVPAVDLSAVMTKLASAGEPVIGVYR